MELDGFAKGMGMEASDSERTLSLRAWLRAERSKPKLATILGRRVAWHGMAWHRKRSRCISFVPLL